MFKIIKSLVMLIILIVPSLISAKEIKISSGEWKPWSGKNLKKNGVAIDIVTSVLKSQGIDSTVKFHAWARSYRLAKAKKYNATAVWFKSEKRAKDFYFSYDIFSTKDMIISKKGKNIKFDTISDLKKYKIILTYGYSYGKEIDDMIANKQLNVKFVYSDLLALKQIITRNTHDIFICANSVAKTIINDKFKDKSHLFEFHKNPTITHPLYFLVSKKSKDAKALISTFNKGLKEFKKKGLIKQMINNSEDGKYEISFD